MLSTQKVVGLWLVLLAQGLEDSTANEEDASTEETPPTA